MSQCVPANGNPIECATHGIQNCSSALLWKIEQDMDAVRNSNAEAMPQCSINNCTAQSTENGLCTQHSMEMARQNNHFSMHDENGNHEMFMNPSEMNPNMQSNYGMSMMQMNNMPDMSSSQSSMGGDEYWKPNGFENFKQSMNFKLPGNVEDLLEPFGGGSPPMNTNTFPSSSYTPNSSFGASTGPLNFGRPALNQHGVIFSEESMPSPKKHYKPCSEPDCKKYAQRGGLCRAHEKVRIGTPNSFSRIHRKCCYPDCHRHAQKFHVCRTHEKLLRDEAQDKLGPGLDASSLFSALVEQLRKCRHNIDCNNTIRSDGLCIAHLPPVENQANDFFLSTSPIGEMPDLGLQNADGSLSSSSRVYPKRKVKKVKKSPAYTVEHSKVPKICLTLNCPNPAKTLGYCKSHERYIRKTQSQTVTGKVMYYIPARCESPHGDGTVLSPTFSKRLSSYSRRGSSPGTVRKRLPSPVTMPVAPHVVMVDPVCTREGCFDAPTGWGTCEAHYVRRCDHDRCSRLADRIGLCLLHRDANMCAVPTCESFVIHRIFCAPHTKKLPCAMTDCVEKTADLETAGCFLHVDEKTCIFPKCPRFSTSDGNADFCKVHGSAKECTDDDCTEWALVSTVCEKHGGTFLPTHKRVPRSRLPQASKFKRRASDFEFDPATFPFELDLPEGQPAHKVQKTQISDFVAVTNVNSNDNSFTQYGQMESSEFGTHNEIPFDGIKTESTFDANYSNYNEGEYRC